MAYNPYTDVSEIVRLKNAYNDDRYVKQGTSYNTYAQEAQQYYQNLRDNNMGDLADELSKADATTAQGILKRYPQSQTAQTANDILQPYQNLTNPQYQNTGQDAVSNAGAISELLSKYTAPSPVMSQSNTQGLANLQALMDMTKSNNQNITSQGNDLWAQMKQFGIDQTGRYEDLYGYIKDTDFLKTPEGQSIMNLYKERGGLAAGDATAAAAGSNSGNIDSYSAANANRQNLSYINAGTNAALNQKNANVSGMLATLQSLGVDVGDLQNRQIAKIQGDQSYNLGLAGEYTQGQGNVANQLQNQQNAQNDMIKSGLDYLYGINTNDTARYQSGLNTAGNVITGGFNAAVGEGTNQAAVEQTQISANAQKYVTDVTSALERYSIDKNAETQKAVQEMMNKAQLDLQALVNSGALQQKEYDVAIANIDAAAKRYGYDMSYKEAEIKAQPETAATSDGDIYDVMSAFDVLVKRIGKQNIGRTGAWAEEQAWLELEKDYAGDKYMLDVIKRARKLYDDEKKQTGGGTENSPFAKPDALRQ